MECSTHLSGAGRSALRLHVLPTHGCVFCICLDLSPNLRARAPSTGCGGIFRGEARPAQGQAALGPGRAVSPPLAEGGV